MLSLLRALTMLTLALPSGASPARPIRIAVVSDTHLGQATTGDLPLYRKRFDEAVEAVNAARVDVVVMPGDVTNGGSAEQLSYFREAARGFRRPVVVIPGNHDVGGKHTPDGNGGVTEASLARYEKALGRSFLVRRVGWLRVVGLNASLLGSGLPQEETQWRSLEREMAKPGPVVLVLHYPLYLKTPDEPSDPYWNVEPAPRARLLALIARADVRAVLSGHLHRPLEHVAGQVTYYSAPPVSFGLPQGKQPEGWVLVTVPASGAVTTEFHPVPTQGLPPG